MMSKKMITSGLALGLVAGSSVGLGLNLAGTAGAANGVIAAASTPSDDTTAETTDDTTAAADDPTGAPDRTARLQEVLQPLIDAGTITQAQADAVIAALDEARPLGGHGPGHGRGRGVLVSLDVAATTIGLTADELRTALEGGSTLAEVAVANGSTAEAVIAAIVADRTERIDAAVTAGTITQAQADERLADLEARVTTMVNEGPRFHVRGGHGPKPGDADGTDGTDAPETTDTTVDEGS